MFGTKWEEITGGREKLHNWEFHDLYYSIYIIKVKHLTLKLLAPTTVGARINP